MMDKSIPLKVIREEIRNMLSDSKTKEEIFAILTEKYPQNQPSEIANCIASFLKREVKIANQGYVFILSLLLFLQNAANLIYFLNLQQARSNPAIQMIIMICMMCYWIFVTFGAISYNLKIIIHIIISNILFLLMIIYLVLVNNAVLYVWMPVTSSTLILILTVFIKTRLFPNVNILGYVKTNNEKQFVL